MDGAYSDQPKLYALNKVEFSRRLAAKTGLSQSEAQAAYDAALEIIAETVLEQRNVSLGRIGTLIAKKKAARTAHSPSKGEQVDVPERIALSIRVGEKFKKLLRGEAPDI